MVIIPGEIRIIFPGEINAAMVFNLQTTIENLVVGAVIEELLSLIEEFVLRDEDPKSEILTGQRREALAQGVGDWEIGIHRI